MKASVILAALAWLVWVCPATGQHTASRLRVEYLDTPLGIDVPSPRFSWALVHPDRGQAQLMYDIVVKYAVDGSVLWDSGKVSSNETTNIAFGGTLKSDTDYTWTVTWWDSTGAASIPASAAFSTGLLQASDWMDAQYVGGANMLRGEFVIAGSGVTRARLYVLGMGYYQSWLNGQKTDPHVLGPFTTFESRLLYDVWDVTPLIVPGCNTLGVMLGAGWYAQPTINAGALSTVLTPPAIAWCVFLRVRAWWCRASHASCAVVCGIWFWEPCVLRVRCSRHPTWPGRRCSHSIHCDTRSRCC
jgi:alpha-L-rhamnosidase